MKVLVVDDDLGSRLVAQSAVQRLGHECATAPDGDHAWELLTTFGPDVLVTDRDMPGLDGIALCQRVRAREQTEGGYIYVVVLTGRDDPSEVTAGMHAGADDYLTKPLDPFALQTRLLAAARVTALHAELAHVRAELARQAQTDPLTGLRNRLGLVADLAQLDDVSHRYERSYCVAMCDLDCFKAYNDAYGHPAGDAALRDVARTLAEQLRSSDLVYRYGGEEFLILLPEQGLVEATAAVERVRSTLQSLAIEHRGAGDEAVLTVSAGVTCSRPGRRPSTAELVDEADRALYAAKRAGRNRTTVADQDPAGAQP